MDTVVEALLQRQRAHPTVDGLPNAAIVGNLRLFIGDATAAQDAAFLRENRVSHVVSLGTGKISPEECTVLDIDILDMEDQLILTHFDEGISFLRAALAKDQSAALVHCVYGQSRSASLCVAFLMAEHAMSLTGAYDTVQQARPCIYINPGFLKQLSLFERMHANASLTGDSNGHAELRAMIAAKERVDCGVVRLSEVSIGPGQRYHCGKCSQLLCSRRNQLSHSSSTGSDTTAGACAATFVEPMKWMVPSGRNSASEGDFGFEKEGKLRCPKCAAKVGSWNWIGVKCRCGVFVTPAFQLIPSRIRYRER